MKFVLTQVMPDTVLPSTICQAIVGEIIRDPSIDLCERKTVVVCSEYSHGYECSVAIRRSLFLAVELRDVSKVNNIEVAVALAPLFGTEVFCIKSIDNLLAVMGHPGRPIRVPASNTKVCHCSW
jgi:hypothetical protein